MYDARIIQYVRRVRVIEPMIDAVRAVIHHSEGYARSRLGEVAAAVGVASRVDGTDDDRE